MYNNARYRKDEDTVFAFKEFSGLIKEIKRHDDQTKQQWGSICLQ